MQRLICGVQVPESSKGIWDKMRATKLPSIAAAGLNAFAAA
jgi:hypothetical protein